MDIPPWARKRIVHKDDHVCEFTVEHPIDADLPSYVKSPVLDRYCAICGTKQTLLQRLQAEQHDVA